MRDINPDPYGPERRSIRNIPVQHRRVRSMEEEPKPPRPRRRPRSRRFWIVGAVFILICVAAGVALSTVFAAATVRVSPRTATVTPPSSITAELDPAVGGLSYQLLNVTRSATTTVPANGTQQVSRSASGLITIYNNYSTASQTLVANTRFESPDGDIYRIHTTTVVPGMSGGKAGSISATIYADQPGTSYNRTGQTTFTIPGFKGEAQYAKFSATSQGDITDGFVGTEPSVAASDLATAQTVLQGQASAAASAAAAASIPEGYVAVPGTLSVTYGDVAATPASNNQATLVEAATAQGAVVPAADLAAAIASKSVQGYNGEAVELNSGSQLNVSASTSTLSQGTLTLNLSGSAVLVWQFDPNALKQALLGKPKSQFQTILQSFTPAIACSSDTPCNASIRPFWLSNFPTDPNKISVIVASK